MDYRDQILALAKSSPLLPSGVAKELKTNSIMAGAMLSEMCDRGILKTSALRVGGSPLYYTPGNESQLLNYVQSLNEKDRRTVSRLQELKVIRESDADPLIRVSLAQIKDFAKPLVVQFDGREERFYKWFELGDSDAEQVIRAIVDAVQKEKVPQTPAVEQKVQREQPPVVEKQKELAGDQKVVPVAPKAAPVVEKKVKREQKTVEREAQAKEEVKKEVKQEISGAVKQEIKSVGEQQTLAPVEKKQSIADGVFWDRLSVFLAQSNIKIKESVVVKKKVEFDLLLELPSPVGPLEYYCKARSKKRVSDGDISTAYVQGQMRKLPVLILTDGELSKGAQEVLDQLKGIAVRRV